MESSILSGTTNHRYEETLVPVEPGSPQVRWFRPDGWNGRRGGLKSRCPRGRKGSNPFLGTHAETSPGGLMRFISLFMASSILSLRYSMHHRLMAGRLTLNQKTEVRPLVVQLL